FLGLGINYSKSVLIGIGIGDNASNSLADAFGCCLGLFPLKYLGIPLGISPRKRIVWIKAADDKLLVMESAWWDCPLLCFSATPVKAVRRDICWTPPAQGFLKFNTDGAARGKPGIEDCDRCGNVLDLLIEANSIANVIAKAGINKLRASLDGRLPSVRCV
ncbi:hypothetical protein Gogos_021379, partial [Gossypium gossypioides]|nr:hypothetical protein [Gossypium gossypioides]